MVYQDILPGVNYDAKVAEQDWKSGRDFTEQAILANFLLAMGSPPNAIPQYGIADLLDPSQVSSTDTGRPLLVTASTLTPLQIQVNPGVAVTPNGAVVNFTGNQQFALASLQAGAINVVYVQNQLIPGGTQPVNDYQQNLNTIEIQNPVVLYSDTLANWQNTSLYPASIMKNIVVIAVVSVVLTSTSTLELQIDQSQTTYPFIRPWFSVRAFYHESKVGTGTVTTQNPHGTSINDLTVAGAVGLLQGLADTGIVISRDRPVNKMLGSNFCSESIPLNRIQIDTLGTITAKSVYGGVNAQYVSLLNYPVRLGSLYETGIEQNSISGEVIPRTNILVLGPHEIILNPLTVEYNAAQALQPPVNNSSNLLVFGQPYTQELIVSGGLTIANIPNPTFDMDGSGPYPRRYRVYMLSDSSLVDFPQILNPSTTLDNLGSSFIVPAQQPIAPARISVGLHNATNVTGMQIQVQISGQDITGANIQETVTISNAGGYVDENIPSTNYDSANQIYQTQQVFANVLNFQVLSRTSDGSLSEIQVWAECEPGTAPTLNDVAEATLVGWNGQGISLIEDARVVARGFNLPDNQQIAPLGDTVLDAARLISNLTASPLLTGVSEYLMTDDFQDLHYFDTISGLYPAVQATGFITIGTNSLIEANDTITIAPGYVLTAVAGSPDTTIGQFAIGADPGTTVSSILTTLVDPTFLPPVTGQQGTGNTINLTYTGPIGALGNSFTITAVLASALSIQVGGYNRGFDQYSECYLDRNVIGLRSLTIPQNSDPYAYGLQYRSRYRSRAISLPAGTNTNSEFCVVVHGQDRFYGSSIRIRGSDQNNPSQWLGWQVMTQAAPGTARVYLATLSKTCHKVQVEIYGRCRGVSLFSIVQN